MENTAQNPLLKETIKSVGAAAMLLALTRTINDENWVKQVMSETGHKFVVTEVGGKATYADFHEKINRAVVGACLNSELIQKKPNFIHALIHATEEAKKGLLVGVASSASLALKIAIVRDEEWIAVALFGSSALHYMTNHERAGLGIMHI